MGSSFVLRSLVTMCVAFTKHVNWEMPEEDCILFVIHWSVYVMKVDRGLIDENFDNQISTPYRQIQELLCRLVPRKVGSLYCKDPSDQ